MKANHLILANKRFPALFAAICGAVLTLSVHLKAQDALEIRYPDKDAFVEGRIAVIGTITGNINGKSIYIVLKLKDQEEYLVQWPRADIRGRTWTHENIILPGNIEAILAVAVDDTDGERWFGNLKAQQNGYFLTPTEVEEMANWPKGRVNVEN